MAMAASVQAQYHSGDLLLGFTSGNGFIGDLVLDLGTASSIGVGGGVTLNLNNNGNVGLSASALQNQLGSLYGSVYSFGVVGASYQNFTHGLIYGTVAQGAAAPTLANVSALSSAVDTAGQTVGDGSGPTANSALYSASQGFGYSWSETILGLGNGTWSKNGTNPDNPFTSSSTVEDLYQFNSNTGVEGRVGTITLFSDGNVVFTPAAVPEPATVSLLGTFGLIALAFRRQWGNGSIR